MTATQGDPPRPGDTDRNAARQNTMRASAARRRRVSRIRRGVIGGSTAAFAAAWAMIFAQLVTGHDPTLAQNNQATAPAPAATASGSSESAPATQPSSPPLDPVTTRQS
jgi:hypothetical protein